MIRPYHLGLLLLVAGGFVFAPHVVARPKGAARTEKPPVLRTGAVPVGSLGHPLGSYLTVEGVRLDAVKTGVSTLRVDTVNGRKLPEPVRILVDNLDLPKDKRCKIKGYESARMIGKPPAVSDAEEEQGKPALEPQAAWQVQLYFVALRVLKPQGLRIRGRP